MIYSRYNRAKRVPTSVGTSATRTQQCFKDECNLGLLVKRCTALSMPLPSPHKVPQYIDLTILPETLQEAMNISLKAQLEFEALPFNIRERFAHDPRKLLAFVHDLNNRDEAITLGLIEKQSIVDVVSPVNDVVPPVVTPEGASA